MSKITFIGGGNMAEALLKGILDGGDVEASSVTVTDIRGDRLSELARTYGVNTSTDNGEAVRNAREVWLCVKPQLMKEVLEPIRGMASPEAVYVSIAAGVSIATIEAVTDMNARVVRVMPNTPALVREGAAGLAAGSMATEEDLELVKSRMTRVGKAVVVSERDLHAVTALSGSGPAYVFYLVEAMLAGAAELGLDPAQARELAVQTVIGAGKLLEASADSPSELRERVTSKGGTTAAALAAFEEAGVGRGVTAGVLAAAARSNELADG